MILISAWLSGANEEDVSRYLDSVAFRVETKDDLHWDYPDAQDRLLSIGFDPYWINGIEETEEIANLISKNEELSFLVIYMRFCVSRKGHFPEMVEAARKLTSELLSHFDGFAWDNEDVFWDRDEIRNNTKKSGLQFLEAELNYASS